MQHLDDMFQASQDVKGLEKEITDSARFLPEQDRILLLGKFVAAKIHEADVLAYCAKHQSKTTDRKKSGIGGNAP